MLPSGSKGSLGTLGGPLPTRLRKVGATVGQYAPNILGHTRAAMVGTELQHRKMKPIPKPYLSWDRGLQPALVNMECLVTARHHRAVNTSLLLAHTARRTTRMSFG